MLSGLALGRAAVLQRVRSLFDLSAQLLESVLRQRLAPRCDDIGVIKRQLLAGVLLARLLYVRLERLGLLAQGGDLCVDVRFHLRQPLFPRALEFRDGRLAGGLDLFYSRGLLVLGALNRLVHLLAETVQRRLAHFLVD